MIEWDDTPEDIGLADGGRINVVSFGWLFNNYDLDICDQWGEPLRMGFYSREAVRSERKRLNRLACITCNQIVVGQEEEYVWQLIGMHPSDYDRRNYLEEFLMAQMEIIFRSQPMARVLFFQQMGVHNSRLAGQWLHYGFYWLLVLTLGGVLLSTGEPARRLGASRHVKL